MEAVTLNLSPTVQRLLSTMTSQQIATALQSVNDGVTDSTTSKITKLGKSKRKSSATSMDLTKATRPLNSWMAYRSYYSPIFLTLQQKEISGLMKDMWAADPFKAKWALLAKAYSMIRDDQGKRNAPLDGFLAINAPFIHVIEPSQYLKVIGWEATLTVKIDRRLLTTNVSVNDLISNSHRQGYFTGNLFNVLLSENEASMMMATASQGSENTRRIDGEHAGIGIAETSDSLDTRKPHKRAVSHVNEQSTNNEYFNDASNTSGVPVPVMNQMVDEVSGSAGTGYQAHQRHTVDHDVGFTYAPGAGYDHMQEQQPVTMNLTALERLSPRDFNIDIEYPFDATFDPDSQPFTFDPFVGNQFDAFDMSDGFSDNVDFEGSTW
ncbi:MAG: hypothetical protein Q9164_000010 [Protoblastenia rupestris]